MDGKNKPFTVIHTPNIAKILFDMKCTLALSTFQAGKVVFITWSFMAGYEAVVLKNFPQLARNYPLQKNTYDSFFVPMVRYNTGALDLHDMNFLNGKLVAVNTLFSCLAEIGSEHSFEPVWQPDFITELAPEDRCHLNGMALAGDRIEYVTALGTTNTRHGWREDKIGGGVIIHVPTGKIVLKGMSMPHSPRLYGKTLFFLNSAMGELCICDPAKGTHKVIATLGGFARGMARYGDYLFIGMSKLRHTTDVFSSLPIAETSFAGIVVVYLPEAKVVGQIRYETSVDEIYDVKILPGMCRPGILNAEKANEQSAIVTPEKSYWAVQNTDK